MCGGGGGNRKRRRQHMLLSLYSGSLSYYSRERNTTLTNRIVQSRLIRLYVLRPSVRPLRPRRPRPPAHVETHSQFSHESQKNPAEYGETLYDELTLLRDCIGLSRPSVPKTTVRRHLLPTDFSRAASQSRRRGDERRGEERRQAAIATSYCPLSSSSLP